MRTAQAAGPNAGDGPGSVMLTITPLTMMLTASSQARLVTLRSPASIRDRPPGEGVISARH